MKKKVLVIGGSSGIGLEITRKLEGSHNVYVASRTADSLQNLSVKHLPMDVTQEDLDESELPDGIDGLVYCPGSINLKPFKMMGLETFKDDMDLNFMGLVRVLKAAVPKLNKGASLVFFSTVAVQTGMPFHTSVAAAKGAIEGFSRALAAELAPTCRVNLIAPSLVDTPLAKRLLNNDAKRDKMAERHPLKKVGTPSDIAQMAIFLLSDESTWITGQTFGVDGGISSLNLN